MEKATIILLIVVLIVVGAFAYFYIKNPTIEQKLGEPVNVSISAKHNNRMIKTGYVIETRENTIMGNTSRSYELQRIKSNQIITAYNENLENQFFFKNIQKINLSKENQRINLKLEESKPIQITISKKNPILINLYSEDARDIQFCLKGSLNYIFIKAEGFENIDLPKKYSTWDNCYNGNFSLKDSNKEINISYNLFGTINEKDYINISLIQKEFIGRNDKIANLI